MKVYLFDLIWITKELSCNKVPLNPVCMLQSMRPQSWTHMSNWIINLKSKLMHFCSDVKKKSLDIYAMSMWWYFLLPIFDRKIMPRILKIFHGVRVPLLNCGSVAKSCSTLCDPVDCNALGFPVLHLPEFAQTPVCWVNDAILLKINDRPLGSLVEYMTGLLLLFSC